MLILDGFQLDSHDWTLDANPIPGIAGTFRDDDQAIVPQDLPTDDVLSSKRNKIACKRNKIASFLQLAFSHTSLLLAHMS